MCSTMARVPLVMAHRYEWFHGDMPQEGTNGIIGKSNSCSGVIRIILSRITCTSTFWIPDTRSWHWGLPTVSVSSRTWSSHPHGRPHLF